MRCCNSETREKNKKKSARRGNGFRFTRRPNEVRVVQRLKSVAPRRRPFRSGSAAVRVRARQYLVRTAATADDRWRRVTNSHDDGGDETRYYADPAGGGDDGGVRCALPTARRSSPPPAASPQSHNVHRRGGDGDPSARTRVPFSAGLGSRAFFVGQSAAGWAAAVRGLPPPRKKTLPPPRGPRRAHRTSQHVYRISSYSYSK